MRSHLLLMSEPFRTILFFLVLLSTINCPVRAQLVSVQATPTATGKVILDQEVRWLRTTDGGLMMAGTDDGLVGIDPVSAKVIWSIREQGLGVERSLRALGNGHFAFQPDGPKGSFLVVQPDGVGLLFDSRTTGLAVGDVHPLILPDCGCLLMSGRSDRGGDQLLAVDLNTGQVRWTIPYKDGPVVEGHCLGGSALAVAGRASITGLDAITGALRWTNDVRRLFDIANVGPDPKVQLLWDAAAPSRLFVVRATHDDMSSGQARTRFVALDVKTGRSAWGATMEVPDDLTVLSITDKGLLLAPAPRSSIGLLAHADGRALWSSADRPGPRFHGSVTAFAEFDDGLLLTLGPTDPHAIWLEPDGQSRWYQGVKLPSALEQVVRTNGPLMLSMANSTLAVDPLTGTVTSEEGALAGSELVAWSEDVAWVHAPKSEQVLRFDAGHPSGSPFVQYPLALQQGLPPLRLRSMPTGLLVDGGNALLLLDNEGAVRYSEHYPEAQPPDSLPAVAQAMSRRDHLTIAARPKPVGAERGRLVRTYDLRSKQGRPADPAQRAFGAPYHYLPICHPDGSLGIQAILLADGGVAATFSIGTAEPPIWALDVLSNTVAVADGATIHFQTVP